MVLWIKTTDYDVIVALKVLSHEALTPCRYASLGSSLALQDYSERANQAGFKNLCCDTDKLTDVDILCFRRTYYSLKP